MLKIAELDDLKIKWPVDIELSKGDPVEIELEFKVLSDEKISELAKKGDEAIILAVVVGWSGIGDANKKHLDFNEDNLKKLCAFSFFRMHVVTAYYEAIATFSRKNSKRR